MTQIPWKRWIALLLLVVVLGVAFVNLGEWQLQRLDERRDKNATVVAHEGAGVLPYGQVFTREIVEADQWQQVTVTGVFDTDPSHQLVVRYRSNGGATGWEIVVPLRASDGRTVLIDRGFVERRPGTDFPASAGAPPAGQVTVVGYVRRNENGGEATIPAQGTIRLINSDDIGRAFGESLVNGYIGVTEMTPAQSGYAPVAPPSLDEGPHLSYALQWFSFTLIAATGLVVFIRNDIRDARKARAKAAAAVAPETED